MSEKAIKMEEMIQIIMGEVKDITEGLIGFGYHPGMGGIDALLGLTAVGRVASFIDLSQIPVLREVFTDYSTRREINEIIDLSLKVRQIVGLRWNDDFGTTNLSLNAAKARIKALEAENHSLNERIYRMRVGA